MERIKHCPYCTPTPDNAQLNAGTVEYSGIELKIVGKAKTLRARHYGEDDIFDHQDFVIINYCPICGRDLSGADRWWSNTSPLDDKWELFDDITTTYYGKMMYALNADDTVYSRYSGENMTFEDAVNEFKSCISLD